jgi:hypothetical protein
MRFVSFWSVMALVALMGAPLGAVGSSPFYLVEYHRYSLGHLGLAGVEGPCDADGYGAVVFCETLQDDRPNKFHVAIRDHVPLPLGGHWEFRDPSGNVLWEGSFCREANAGPIPLNATKFVVRVDLRDDCGVVASQGWVIVTWRWTPEAPITVPPEEPHPCPCPCTCQHG